MTAFVFPKSFVTRVTLCAAVFAFASPSAHANKDPATLMIEAKVLNCGPTVKLPELKADKPANFSDKEVATLLESPDVDVISAPRLIARNGAKGEMRIEQQLQYFKANEDGTFSLEKLGEKNLPGLRIQTIAREKKDNTVDLTLSLSIRTVAARQKLEGVDLDVGEPILSTTAMNVQVVLQKGTWMLAAGSHLRDQQTKREERLLILVRVSDAPAP